MTKLPRPSAEMLPRDLAEYTALVLRELTLLTPDQRRVVLKAALELNKPSQPTVGLTQERE